MNWKVAVILLLIFFTSAVTAAVSLNVPNLSRFNKPERKIVGTDLEPLGDPVDGGAPH